MIITWAMGLTQHQKAVATVKEIINLLLLRGNIGKPGAGPSPIRGHSNVQGDRTMGIWEKMPPSFLDALAGEFGFDPPREHGMDAVQSIQGMRDGRIKVFVALGGNLVSAISDTSVAEAAVRKTRLSVQISTKLNRSHAFVGEQAMILPTLGRSEIDRQPGGDYNSKVRQEGGFILPHPPRDSRTFPTPSGKAVLTVNELQTVVVPQGQLLLQTIRSHDQFNTTMYGLNDRYRGVKNGRHVLFVNPDDLADLGLVDGSYVDVHSEYDDGEDRVLRQFRLIAYPSARGCVSAYYPETNVLVSLEATAEGSNTPISKSVPVQLEPAAVPV